MEEWVCPQPEAWYHGVRIISKTSARNYHMAYTILGMSLQLEWKHLEQNVPKFRILMGQIKTALR